ncbi:MAG: adenylate/guanylate cyclase domain-containing protein [Deltaproteobacteria bacterium]|nr:adenylate/guanylate cyclase domain-containing protein [Deltaproteobacteria bacterium]
MQDRPAPTDLITHVNHGAAVVVDDSLSRVALHGERVHAQVRIAVTVAMALLWPIMVWSELRAGQATAVGVEVLCLVGGAAGLLWRELVRRQRRMSVGFGVASSLLDVALAWGLGLVVTLHPPSDYFGTLHSVGFPILYLAVVASGMRLSRRSTLVTGAVAAAGLVVLHVIDRYHNVTTTQDTGEHVAIAMFLVAAATLVAFVSALRARSVALEVAEQALRAQRARDTLGSYVSEEVAAHALASDAVRLGGSRKYVAVLFTDLRGFTSSSETAEPEDVVADLNEYFEAMVGCLSRRGGVVDKYIGDSIMAVFGAPVTSADDASRAVLAAFEMQHALVALNERRARRGRSPLFHGIGVHAGVVIAGNIGTTKRASYTVIGDTVNVAARLESATKEHGVPVLLSADVLARADPSLLPPLVDVASIEGGIVVKGRAQPIAARAFAAFAA